MRCSTSTRRAPSSRSSAARAGSEASSRKRIRRRSSRMSERTVRLAVDDVTLDATLGVPANAFGAVLFAHGSGSSRHSPRNRFVASALHQSGLATLLLDLLTAEEER